MNNQESELHVPLTPNEVVAAKFKLGRSINHLVGVYNLPEAEVDEHKQDIIDAVRRIK